MNPVGAQPAAPCFRFEPKRITSQSSRHHGYQIIKLDTHTLKSYAYLIAIRGISRLTLEPPTGGAP